MNISGDAGITGNNQEPVNWGPPALNFAGSGITGLSDTQATFNRIMTNTLAYDGTWNHGRHNFSFGVGLQTINLNYLTQTDPRGTFTFSSTDPAGYDFAGFLLGLPGYQLHRLRKCRQVFSILRRRCVRGRRLARQSGTFGESRRSLGVQRTDHGTLRAAGESGYRPGL